MDRFAAFLAIAGLLLGTGCSYHRAYVSYADCDTELPIAAKSWQGERLGRISANEGGAIWKECSDVALVEVRYELWDEVFQVRAVGADRTDELRERESGRQGVGPLGPRRHYFPFSHPICSTAGREFWELVSARALCGASILAARSTQPPRRTEQYRAPHMPSGHARATISGCARLSQVEVRIRLNLGGLQASLHQRPCGTNPESCV